MNLYAIAHGNLVGGIDILGLVKWTEATALCALYDISDEWKEKGYNLASDLMEAFVGNDGSFTYSEANILEIKKHGKSKICSEISKKVCSPLKIQLGFPGKVDVDISHDGGSSNVRWWYVLSNKNMLFAYGGAKLNAKGVAEVKPQSAGIGSFSSWSGTFQIQLEDTYEWVKKDGKLDIIKQWVSQKWSEEYDAAVYLESNHNYKTFTHNVSFELECSGACTTISTF